LVSYIGVHTITFVHLSQSSSSLSLKSQIRFIITYAQEGTCNMIPKVVKNMRGKTDKYFVT